ncbi:hypothetical protein Tco_1108177 [Tanacetum coccineum]
MKSQYNQLISNTHPPLLQILNQSLFHQLKKTQTTKKAKRGQDTEIPQSGGPSEKVGDEAVHKELGDRIERATTTTSSLEAEQESGNINRTQSMATLNDTSKNGEMEITTTIDGRVKTVTEASIRRHLKLEDSNSISTLPNTKFFEQLALMGYGEGSTIPVETHHTPTNAPSTSQPHISSTLRSPIRQETEVPQLSSLPHTNVANETASTGVDVRHGGAATTVTSLHARQGSDNINKTPSMPHDSSLPRGHTLGSDEGIMQHNELMDLVTKLSDRCEALETHLRQTKKVYGDAFTKLIKKVKTLEKTIKTSQARRRARVVISDDEEELEDPSKQGWKIAQIDQDPTISLVQDDAEIQGRYGQDMEYDFDLDAAKDVSTTAGVTTVDTTPISTTSISTDDVDVAGELTLAETLMAIKSSASKTQKLKGVVFKEPSESTTPRPQPKINAKDKGKGIMQEPEKSPKNPVKAQIQLDKELALRLHAKKQAKLERMQRERDIQEGASNAILREEFDDVQTRMDADGMLQEEEREQFSINEQKILGRNHCSKKEVLYRPESRD